MAEIQIFIKGEHAATIETHVPSPVTLHVNEADLRNGTEVVIKVVPSEPPPSKIDGEVLPR